MIARSLNMLNGMRRLAVAFIAMGLIAGTTLAAGADDKPRPP